MEKQDHLYNLRHSAAHLLNQAVAELFPGTLPTIGPVTENGFFYDFLPVKNFKEEVLPVLEAKMHEIAKRGYKIIGNQVPKEEARTLYKDNQFKLELIDQIEGDTVGIYHQGPAFFDLCRGGHVEELGEVKYFKLMSVSGAYWRADRNGIALQRIAGVCFETKEKLDEYLQLLEDVAKYDHRKLGKQLDLFSFHEVAPGMAFFHAKGLKIYNLLIEYMRKLYKQDYQEIRTPMIVNESLWRTSGHYDNYKDNMYFTQTEDVSFCVKPMNCPGSILFYQERPHSYRELPLRIAEFGTVHRRELAGTLHGLFRVRVFTQDDAHHYCTVEQIESEVTALLKLAQHVYSKFGFTRVDMALSTRPEKYIGTDEVWNQATEALRNALDANKVEYVVNDGDGAFYGPKIDMRVYDAMGRAWQCGTIQVDFFQPMNFELEYIDSDQSRKRPVIIHRAIYGSLERFLGIVLEHYKGNLPFWIAPVQIRVLKISEGQAEYAQQVFEKLLAHGFRVEQDLSGDQISAQIRRAQLEKVPWMMVIGQKEVDQGTVTLRHVDGKQEFGLSLDVVIERARVIGK